jgi:hypothetical protein
MKMMLGLFSAMISACSLWHAVVIKINKLAAKTDLRMYFIILFVIYDFLGNNRDGNGSYKSIL